MFLNFFLYDVILVFDDITSEIIGGSTLKLKLVV